MGSWTNALLVIFVGSLLLLVVEGADCSDGTCPADGTVAHNANKDCYHHETDDIIKWVEKHGGFVDKRLQIKSGSIGRGFFTTEDLKKDEEIVRVPFDLIIQEGDHPCHTCAKLRDELMKGTCSKYWPYLKFVRDVELDLPNAWSVEELQVLDGLPPGDWSIHTNRLIKDCPGQGVDLNHEDPFALRALFLYATRAGPEGMQPIFDIFNHGFNSTWHYTSKDKKFHTFAMRYPVKAGSEVYNQFRPGVAAGAAVVRNMLRHNTDPDGAPEMLRDYGFLEPPPTAWHFQAKGTTYYFVQEDEHFTASFLPKSMNFQAFVKQGEQLLANLSKRSASARDGGVPCLDPEYQQQPEFCGGNPRRVALGMQYRQTFIGTLESAIQLAKTKSSQEDTAMDKSARANKVRFENPGDRNLYSYWIDMKSGQKHKMGVLEAGGSLLQDTHPGHVFRFYADEEGRGEALHEYIVRSKPAKQKAIFVKGAFRPSEAAPSK